MIDPKYLKLRVKPFLSLLLCSTISLGFVPFFSSSFASKSEGGKYIASNLDLVIEYPMCIIRLKCAKRFCNLPAASLSSFFILKRNILSLI